MSWRNVLLTMAAAAVIAASLAPSEASARRRGTMSTEYYDRDYCGRLPAYGFDGCGHREFGYGPDSCWRRVIVNSPDGPRPRRVFVCG
jgi:hypothetical protein